jgi:hypothetical protein
MRVGICTAAIVLASVATVAAEVVNVMPASCRRRETLDAAEYQRMWRFLPLGGGYRMWADKDCYPYRVTEAALASVERPVGTIVDIGGRDVFVVDLDPVWFRRCTKTATPVTGNIAVDGPTLLYLDRHLASLPSFAALDIREIGFGEAGMRDKRALFALYLGNADRSVYLECFDDLDAAVERAAQELGRAAPAARSAP